jgi:phosphoglucosamine mutase
LRRYFGTDGVRGIVGEDLTPELVERLGRAATLWSRAGASSSAATRAAPGPELEEAFARGIVAAGGNAVLAGVLPTPAVALLALDLGAVISASHNPPEYNGVKFFDREGQKLTTPPRRRSRRSRRAVRGRPGRSTASASRPTATSSTSSSASAPTSRAADRGRLRERRVLRDRARGVRAARRRGDAIGADPDGTNINVGCGATDLRRCSSGHEREPTSGSRSTATATGCWRSTRAARSSTATRSSRS